MIVTKENFNEALGQLRESIPSASFISIDEEMTGIFGTTDAERIRRDDVPSSRYQRMVPVASKYRLIQFGMCLFHEKGVNSDGAMTYSTATYTFYLFPEANSSSNGELVLSLGAIEFLKKNHMDFGKWIEQGIPYVSRSDLEFHRKRIFKTTAPATDANGESKPKNSIVLTTPSDLEFMNRNMGALKSLVDGVDENASELTLEPCNAYLRRYIYQTVEALYSDSIVLSKSTANPNALCARKVNAEQKTRLAEEELQKQETQFRAAVGFAAVYDLLTSFGGPIVGHNCLFDLLFLLRWLEGPLPTDFAEFRVLLSHTLPNVYDTKFFASENVSRYASGGSEDTTLQMCYEKEVLGMHVGPDQECSVSDPSRLPVFEKESVGEDGEAMSTQFHDAGWDAYCTGCLFATQVYIATGRPVGKAVKIGEETELEVGGASSQVQAGDAMQEEGEAEEGEVAEAIEQPAGVSTPVSVPGVSTPVSVPGVSTPVSVPGVSTPVPVPVIPRNSLDYYRNKLFMMRSMFHMNLGRAVPGPRAGPTDTGVFNKGPTWNEIGGYMKYACQLLYVSGFAPNTNNSDIISAFTSGSSPLRKDQLYVSWVDNVGFFVQINAEHTGSSESFIQRCKDTCLLPEAWVVVDYDEYLQSAHPVEARRALNRGLLSDPPADGDTDADELIPLSSGLVRTISDTISSVFSGLIHGAGSVDEKPTDSKKPRI